MAGFSVGDQFTLVPGSGIWVDPATGDDGTGDGSEGNPYATVGRGTQDIRSGRNDVVILLGDTTEAQVQVANKDDWALIGLGSPTWAQNTRATCFRATSTSRGTGGNSIDVLAANSLSNGDVLIPYDWVTNSSGTTQPILTAAPISLVSAGGFRFPIDSYPGQGSASVNAFPLTRQPAFTVPQLDLNSCNGVTIQGVRFQQGAAVSNFGGGVSVRNCSRVTFRACNFFASPLSLAGPSVLSLIGDDGTDYVVDGCNFSLAAITTGGTFDLTRRRLPYIINCAANSRVLRSIFGQFLLTGGFVQGYLDDEDEYQGVIVVPNLNPVSLTVADCLLVQLQSDNEYTRLFYTNEDSTVADISTNLNRIFARANFYTNRAVSGQRIQVSSGQLGDLFDEEPAEFAGQGDVNNYGNPVWRKQVASALVVSGSMGGLVAALEYDGAIHVDHVSGTSGAELGVNGTSSNPVDNIPDARTLADALGIRRYSIRGTCSGLATGHPSWEFVGKNGPENDAIIVSSGADLDGTSFQQIRVQGVLSGFTTHVDTIIGSGSEVTELWGNVLTQNGAAEGTLRFMDGVELAAVNLTSRSQQGTTVDYNGQQASALASSSAGVWSFANMNQALSVLGWTSNGSIITLPSTVSAGVIILAGVGALTDSKSGATSFSNTMVERGIIAGVSGQVAAVDTTLGVVSGEVSRLYGANTRTRLHYAVGAVAGRNVPDGGASHMEVSIKAEAAADWSSPSVHYVVFAYRSGATTSTPPAVATISGSAPTDGTFTVEPF